MAEQKDLTTATGKGGETHQQIPKQETHDAEGHLTTDQGIRIAAVPRTGISRLMNRSPS